jgi:hypothetical protein
MSEFTGTEIRALNPQTTSKASCVSIFWEYFADQFGLGHFAIMHLPFRARLVTQSSPACHTNEIV